MSKKESFLIIPAAGLGTRMKSVKPGFPKEMLPINNKPAIQYTVEEGISAGINNIIVIISRLKETVKHFLEEFISRKIKKNDVHSLTVLYQEHPHGESDALYLAKETVGDNPVAVMYPDNIFFPHGQALVTLQAVYEQYMKDVVALMKVTPDNAPFISNSGKVDTYHICGNVYRIDYLYPKTEGGFQLRFPAELRTCGISISGPHVFKDIEQSRNIIKKGEELSDRHVRIQTMKERELYGCLLNGSLYDIGNPEGYKECQKYAENLEV
jgi:UTP--glucose-1-phosphate uridylyltransferase